MLQSPNEKLARERNIYAHVAVHGMLAQQIDAEFFAGLCKAPLSVQSDHVSEDAAALVPMKKLQELFSHFDTRLPIDAIYRALVVIVYSRMLVTQGAVEYATAQRMRREHTGHEWLELDIAMVKRFRNRAL